jgi:hypothetical protein
MTIWDLLYFQPASTLRELESLNDFATYFCIAVGASSAKHRTQNSSFAFTFEKVMKLTAIPFI